MSFTAGHTPARRRAGMFSVLLTSTGLYRFRPVNERAQRALAIKEVAVEAY